ncbi:MAG: GH39 family glycosyl hydrolase [Mucilaginibacter sp.]
MLNLFNRTGMAILIAMSFQSAIAQNKAADVTNIVVDLKTETGPMKPIWAWFGHDEPNYTYMKDGRKLLGELAALSPVPVYVRTHNLLTSGDGTASLKWGSTNIYTEDAQGNPIYNYRIVDSIFDTYMKLGIKPLAQLSFMPQALSTKPDPYTLHWHPGLPNNEFGIGWAYPPKDYKKWGELVYHWVKHCVERYGRKEVESWYWEVWNEPDISYWRGTIPEYCKLYDYAADGLKRALPTARIGGADVTGGGMKFLNAFLTHCLRDTNYVTGKIGSPLDLVSFHAKGSPKVVNGIVMMNGSRQLHNIADNFKVIGNFPELKNIPVILGESDPEGCAACGMATSPENAYRNGTMYSSYTAATVAREYELAADYQKNLIGSVNWSFEFENQPWFAGYRDLATNGVDKPVLNVFRMFGMMTGNKVKAASSRMYPLNTVMDSGFRSAKTDIGVLAAKDKHFATIMVWNYHDEDKQGAAEPVKVQIKGVPANSVTITEYRVDNDHSNSYEVWKKMGSPQSPTAAQINQLEQAGQLQTMKKPDRVKVADGAAEMRIALPRQGVSLVKVEW